MMEVILPIDNTKRIVITSSLSINEVLRFSEGEAYLIDEEAGERYLLNDDFFTNILLEFNFHLVWIFARKGELTNAIARKTSVGYAMNLENHQDGVISDEDECSKYWLWSTAGGGSQTWMYTVNGDIILEVSQLYPWHHLEPEEGEVFIPFEEWIKSNYKIALKQVISQETAQQWQKTCRDLLDTLGLWLEEEKDDALAEGERRLEYCDDENCEYLTTPLVELAKKHKGKKH